MDVIRRLNSLAVDNLSSILLDSYPIDQVSNICVDISAAVQVACSNESIQDKDVDQFLKVSLPRLAELLFRRKTVRENERNIFSALEDIVRILAAPSNHTILELCDLRNLILLGGAHYGLVFIDTRQTVDPSKSSNSCVSYGHSFYSEFGKPVNVIIGGRSTSFWPDEWRAHLGGLKAVGFRLHFLNREMVINEGLVTNYDATSDLYEITSKIGESEFTHMYDLTKTKHWWIDSSQNLGNSNNSVRERLVYSHTDNGKFVRIWWSRYNRFYYGRIIAFDNNKLTHTITYEDKDTRVYDMRSKDYEIISVPLEVAKRVVGLQDAAAAQIASEWHRTKGLMSSSSSKESNSTEIVTGNLTMDMTQNRSPSIIPRPLPTMAFNLSMYQFDLINLYFQAGGTESMLKILYDPDKVPPPIGVILSHLQFLYQMKPYLGPKKFRNLTWDLKEAISSSISRFDETQLKDFNLREYCDVHNLLKDIITIVANEANDSVASDLMESLDYLRLTIAIKLFSTLKVQKRSIGLSILKDYIEVLHPKIPPFLQKRYVVIGNRKVSANSRTLQVSKQFGRTFISVNNFDRWFLQSNFIELLLGERFHQDLVSKADAIFVYMAHRHLLTEMHIAMLWQCTKGAHEAVVRAVHTLILAIIPALDLSLRNHLFSLISSSPRRDYSVQFVEFISKFTIQVVRTISEEENRISNSQENLKETSKKDDKSQNSKTTMRAKAQIINAPQRQYFGFKLLWSFVLGKSDESDVLLHNEDVIEAAVTAIVDLLRDEFVEDKEAAMQTCIENVELGISVPTSLALLRRVLLLYPSPSKSWFVLTRQPVLKGITIAQQVDKLIKQNRLLDILFLELESYHRRTLMNKSPEELFQQIRLIRPSPGIEKSKGRDVIERLEFLQFILSKASVKLTENHLSILWRVFGESGSNGETIDSLCSWLDALVYTENKKVGNILRLLANDVDPFGENLPDDIFKFLDDSPTVVDDFVLTGASEEHISIVDETILVNFFETNILPWAFSEDKVSLLSRPSVASLFIKLFLFVNLSKKTIRVENETAWSRVGNLVGSAVLWRIAMDTTHVGASVICSKLLVELQHRSVVKAKTPDGVRGNFMQLCFKQLYFVIQNLQSQEEINDRSEVKADNMVYNVVHQEWFESNFKVLSKEVALNRVARLVTILRQFMCRFYYSPAHFIKIKVFSKRDDLPVCNFRVVSTETVGSVRLKISNFFKESPESMLVYIRDNNERLDKDTTLVGSLKSCLEISLITRKAESAVVVGTGMTKSQSHHAVEVPDVILLESMKKSLVSPLSPLLWLHPGKDKSYEESLALPIVSPCEKFSQYIAKESAENLDSAMDYLSGVVKINEKYIDQLLEMLDGFFAAEKATSSQYSHVLVYVWDILQLLPLQPSMVFKVSQIAKLNESTIMQLLDVHNPNRLLYFLQIFDSIFESTKHHVQRLQFPSDLNLSHWSIKFCESGGLDHILQILKEVNKLISISADEQLCQNLAENENDSISGKNLYFTISSYILRFLHRFLQVDTLYRSWQIQPSTIISTGSDIVPGLFLSLIDADLVMKDIVELLKLLFTSYTRNEISVAVLSSVGESATLLSLGLCTAIDDGLKVITNSNLLGVLLQNFCGIVRESNVRYSVASAFLMSSINIFHKCVDPVVKQEKKSPRIALLDYLHSMVVDCVVSVKPPSSVGLTLLSPHMDTIYNLVAAIECFRVDPSTVIDEISLGVDISSNDVVSLVDTPCLAAVEANNLDPVRYFPVILHQLAVYQSTESFHSTDSDATLIALLRIILVFSLGNSHHKKLLQKSYEIENTSISIISFIYNRCLFPRLGESTSVLCQTQYSRLLAFEILSILSAENPCSFHDLVISMTTSGTTVVSENRKRRRHWDYDPTSLLKRSGEYLGLKNQGGTCYMNSFLQQLYHIKAFREGIMQVSKYPNEKEYENVLFQLQVMFGYLKLSQKKYFDTISFCQSIIDYDGQPISLTEQKDINEFAGMLFDKLEKTSDCNEILKSTIRGTLVWKTKSLETPYRSEREESFYMITLEVKDKKRIEDSLELSVAEELFSGENKIEDSVAGIKVDATRRAAIRHLPPTMVVQLKRFEFDLETMNRKKLNDYMSFPMELDMFPYTEEGIFSGDGEDVDCVNEEPAPELDDGESEQDKKDKYTPFRRPVKKPDSHYKYVLTGVVAHVGAIDRGHYYSFIKERDTDNWYEFNDRLVLPFSSELIPRECFGGVDETSNPSGPPKFRENNAYLLVYERKGTVGSTISILSPSLSNTNIAEMHENGGEFSPVSEVGLRSPLGGSGFKGDQISESVLRFIMAENAEFQLDRFRYDASLFSFMWSLANSKSLATILNSFDRDRDDSGGESIIPSVRQWSFALMHFIVEVAIHARAKACTLLIIEKLEELIVKDKSRESALYVLEALCTTSDALPNAYESAEPTGLVTNTRRVPINVWLETILLDCPNAAFVTVLRKTIKSMILSLSVKLEREGSRFCQLEADIIAAKNSENKMDSGEEAQSSVLPAVELSPQDSARSFVQRLSDSPLCLCVAKFCDQLLCILEQMTVDDIYYKDGFNSVCDILNAVSSTGTVGLNVLLRLRTLERVVLIILSVNSTRQQIPSTKSNICFELTANIIKGCFLHSSPGNRYGTLLLFSDLDKQAYLNKIFLNESIMISTQDTSAALQLFCKGLQLRDNLRLMDFISEKIIEYTATNNGTSVLYRPFLKIFSDLLLGPLLLDLEDYNQALRKLASSAFNLSTRQQLNDAEFVYAICKLLHRIGTTGPVGYAVVMQFYDFWRDISVRFAHSAPKKQSLSVFSLPQQGNNTNGNQGKF